jgi:hypothetical protein
VVIGTDSTGSCNSNYHVITTITAPGNIGYTSHKTKTKKTKKHNTICIGHHYAQTNTKNVNKILALLQTNEGKDEPNIVFMQKS